MSYEDKKNLHTFSIGLENSPDLDNAEIVSKYLGTTHHRVELKVGDFISSSPASTLLPPNIPIGIVQSVGGRLKGKKTAKISLIAKPHAIDWVQILKLNNK